MTGNETKLFKRTTKMRKTEVDFKVPPAGYQDWRLELIHTLVAAGTNGIKQSHLQARFQNWADGPTIRHELEALRAEGKVQKFIIPLKGSGTAPTVWRATTKILED